MIAADVIRSKDFATTLVPESPFIWVGYSHNWTLAETWGDTWSDILIDNDLTIGVKQVCADYLDKLLWCNTLADCRTQPGSFFFDTSSSMIYVHTLHDSSPIDENYDYGYGYGVVDSALGPVDYDGRIWMPYIDSAPDLEITEDDTVDQSQPTGVTGSLVLNNYSNRDIETGLPTGGFDWILSESILGNDVYIYDYEDKVMTPLMVLYVEDYDGVSLETATLNLQSKRFSSQTIYLPTFTKTDYPYIDDSDIGSSIPVLYGTVSAMKLTCINPNEESSDSSIIAQYRLPELCSNYGTAYIESDDTFIAADVAWVDYNLKILAIRNGRNSSGSSRSVKLTDCVGYIVDGHSYPADIIEHFLSEYGNIKYTASNFDKTEFEAELANAQSDIGFVIDSDVDLWTLVYDISCKSIVPFRVDYTSEGKITARIRNLSRASTGLIPSALIKNTNTLEATTARDSVYSSTVCKYGKNYYDDTWLSVENNTYYDDVRRTIRKESEYELESYLVNSTDAESRAYFDATRLADMPVTVSLQVYKNYYLRIYDVVTISIQPDNLNSASRQYIGNKDCLIVGINPQSSELYNQITALIIPDRIPIESQGSVRSTAYTTTERAKSSLDIVSEIASGATNTWATLALAQANGKSGDLFTEGGVTYRANYATSQITIANSTRITTIRFPDVADITALNALTGMINYDTVYQLDTLQWYYYLNGWQTDGSTPLNGQYTANLFAKNTSPTAYPTLEQVDAPDGWYDTPPTLSDSEYLWFTNSTWRDTTRLSNWTTPVRISGTLTTLTVEYSVDGINWTTSTTGAIYMRTSPDGGTTWTDAIRIKGETGAQGASGSGLYVSISDPTETSATYTNGQLGTFAGYNYIWTATSGTTGYWILQEKTAVSSVSLFSYLSLDENSLTEYGDYLAIDNSGNSNHGYAKNAIIAAGFRGNGLQITARNQYLNI